MPSVARVPKEWLRANARGNLLAAEKLVGFNLTNPAANRLWYSLYHACWAALQDSRVEPEHVQQPRLGRPDVHKERWFHETMTGRTMQRASAAKSAPMTETEIDALLKAVRNYRNDADYTGAPVNPEKIKDRWAQAQRFINHILKP